MKGRVRIFIGLLCCVVGVVFLVSPRILADSFTGTSYKIDASVMNGFGGDSTSTSYGMTSSGGESIIGQGLGGSYLLSEGYTSQINKSLQVTMQPYGLVNYFSMDESQGPTAYDWTVNNNNATNTAGNFMQWTTGKKNGAVDQASTTGHLETSAAPLGASSNFTFDGWFYPNTTTSGMVLFGQDDNTGTGDKWSVTTNASGSVTFSMTKSGVTTSAVASTPLTTSVWQYIVVTYDGSTMRVYRNGTQIAQQANSAGSHTFSLPLSIGDYNTPASSHYFDGRIDEMRIYNRTLDATEIRNDNYANVVVNPGFVTIPAVTPGTSSSVQGDIVVQTDAPGYNINMNKITNLNSQVYSGSSIPPISTGTVASPAPWSEGTTKGLGFAITSAPSLDSKWGTSPNYNYAAIPASATTIYSRSGGYTGGAKETVRLQYRLDVDSSQTADWYLNLSVISGTILP